MDCKIENIRFYQEGVYVESNGIFSPTERWAYSFDFNANDQTNFNNLKVRVSKYFDGVLQPFIQYSYDPSEGKTTATTYNYYEHYIDSANTYGYVEYRGIIQLPDEAAKLNSSKILFKFEIVGTNQSYSKEFNFPENQIYSEEGLATLGVIVLSNRSDSGKLDRVAIVNTDITVVSASNNTIVFNGKTGTEGYIDIRNLQPGKYRVTAKYKEYSKESSITLIADDRDIYDYSNGVPDQNNLSILLDIRPADVQIISSDIKGRITKYGYIGMPNVSIRLYKAQDYNSKEGSTFVASTTTNADGTFEFTNVDPDAFYYLDHEEISGYSKIYTPTNNFILLQADLEKVWMFVEPE